MYIYEDKNTVFDVHLASDVLSPDLATNLASMGFRADRFVAGTSGVLHRHHLTNHPQDASQLKDLWQGTVAVLQEMKPEEFYGYAEAEVIAPQFSHRIDVPTFRSEVAAPFGRLLQEACPIDKYKDCDFHVSAEVATLDPGLEDVLEHTLGMYHVDILKQSGETFRVFTFQPMGIEDSAGRHYRALLRYLQEAGGMRGKVKLEATYAYHRFPADAKVPPIVRQLPRLAGWLSSQSDV